MSVPRSEAASDPSDPSYSKSPALEFKVLATCGRARRSRLVLPHYECHTPMFMPVGTQGTVKGLTVDALEELDCHVILGNTYHLGLRPGEDVIDSMGGLHEFMGWPRGMLTDSGGFQMVSLLDLSEMNEEGVSFKSPHDGSMMLLTPEKSIGIQNKIGADIMMALDDVVSSQITGPRVEEAMWRTIRWIDRCISAHARPDEQNLFGIVQGGLDADLRKKCLDALVERDLPGYAIGGLSGGESKDDFWRMVDISCQFLPSNKPRYLMGVGYALDLVVCSALGVDMFDCVFPTRTARFGSALVRKFPGSIDLKKKVFATDTSPMEEDCGCKMCTTYTRAYLHTVTREPVGCSIVSYHNVAFQMGLMRDIRAAIEEQTFPAFVQNFIRELHPQGDCPSWAVDALAAAGISLE